MLILLIAVTRLNRREMIYLCDYYANDFELTTLVLTFQFHPLPIAHWHTWIF